MTASTTAASAAMGYGVCRQPHACWRAACPPQQAASGTFLRLLLACGSTTTLEQAGDWTRSSSTYLRAPKRPSRRMHRCWSASLSAFRLTPMEDPFLHQGVQASFDGGKLHHTDDITTRWAWPARTGANPLPQGFEFEARVVFASEKEDLYGHHERSWSGRGRRVSLSGGPSPPCKAPATIVRVTRSPSAPATCTSAAARYPARPGVVLGHEFVGVGVVERTSEFNSA